MRSRTTIEGSHLPGLLVISTLLTLAIEPRLVAEDAVARPATELERDGPAAKTILAPTEEKDRFDYETDRMRGTISLDGAYHGVARLVDKRTGIQVIDSRYSALNLFKFMSVNQCMGQPRLMERKTASGENWVEVTWPATESHLADVTARYEVVTPGAVDLTVTVHSNASYRGYELFLSNYFDKRFRPHVYLRTRDRRERELVVPTVNDAFRGTVLVFPRDAHAARRCLDGRWERRENKTPIVQMCPLRHYALCVAFMADEDNQLGVVLMSKPSDCYAISTRYHADDDADRLTTYSAFDLSLFGDDLLPLAKRTVKVRQALTEIDSDRFQLLELYREFLAETPADQPVQTDAQE